MKNLLFLPLAFLLVVGCTSKTETLKDEVMAIHDEVMPRMQDIMNLKKQARQQIDSLSSDTLSQDARIEELEQLIQELEEADEAMMGWMRAYKRNFEGSDEEYMEYLMGEKQKIQQVRDEMMEAINEAEATL